MSEVAGSYGFKALYHNAFHAFFVFGYGDLSLFSSEKAVLHAKSEALSHIASRLTDQTDSTVVGNQGDNPLLKHLSNVLNNFEIRLDTATREEDVQQFLQRQPFVLSHTAVKVRNKHRLGTDYITDFVIELPRQEYVFVELEATDHQLFTQDGNPRAALIHALRQVHDWLEFVSEHRGYARATLPGIHEPRGLIILGPSNTMQEEHWKLLRRMNAEQQRVEIITYDQLLERARQHLENMRQLESKREGENI